MRGSGYTDDVLRVGGYAEVRPRRAAASPVQDSRSPASIARCRSFASSRQRPHRAAVLEMMGCCATLLNFHASTQIHWHTYVHTMYKAHQAGNRPRRTEPRTPCHVYTATVLHCTRTEKHMERAIKRTSIAGAFMKFRDANISYAGHSCPRFLLRSVRLV
jgi:hypothetical protein